MADVDKFFFNKIITGNETWCFAYDPETKRQSSEWVGETSLRPKKKKRTKTKKTEILKVPHQDHVDKFWKNSKCIVL
jgi:hypothetical protein